MKGINNPMQVDSGHPYKALVVYCMLLFCSTSGFSQFTLRFSIAAIPGSHLPDSVFVAGNFNSWNPSKNGNKIVNTADSATIKLDSLSAGNYQFKFTRGSWLSVECMPGGKDVDNRVLNLMSDTVVHFSVAAWKDDFGASPKLHTASGNVHIMDTAFAIPQLNRTRRIWMYLPPGYNKSGERYPVIYMQDGQNIFDEYTSGFGEWGVDECIDSMIGEGRQGCIIVGIDNGPKRLNEYNPYPFRDVGKGEGDEYTDFIVDNLKPFIDKNYRTLPGRENTAIAGSSMGALIAYYAILKYPAIFGKAGIFSPSFWTAEKIKDLTDSSGKNLSGTLFFYIGGQEGDRYIEDMNDVAEKLGKNSKALIYVLTDPRGNHNEQAWRKWFPEFYQWVVTDGFNNLIDLKD